MLQQRIKLVLLLTYRGRLLNCGFRFKFPRNETTEYSTCDSKRSQRLVRVFVTCFICCFVCLLFGTDCFAEDDSQSVLEGQDYPWYDSTSDGFKPLSIPPERVSDDMNFDVDPSGLEMFFSTVMYAMLWILVGILVIGLVVLLYRTFTDSVPDYSSEQTDRPGVKIERLDMLPEMTRGVTDFLSEAKRLANSGEFSQAMIFYYAWQLVTLGEKDILELEAGKTNQRYLREAIKKCPSLKTLFTTSVRKFEDAIYGGITISAEEFKRLWQHRDEFEQAVRVRPANRRAFASTGRNG